MVDPVQVAQFATNGLVIGSVLTLTAVGLTLVYGILHLANFAHGDLITLGAYLGLLLTALIPMDQQVVWAVGALALLSAAFVADILLAWLRGRDGGGEGLGTGPKAPLGGGNEVGGGGADSGGALSATERAVGLYLGLVLAALVLATVFPPPAWGAVALLPPFAAAAAGVAAALVAASGRGDTALRRRLAKSRWTRLGLAAAGLLTAYLFGGSFLLGVLLAVVTVAAIVMALDLVIWKPLRAKGAGLLTLIIASIGLALALRNAIIMGWGTGIRPFPGPVRQAKPVLGTEVVLTESQIVVIAVAFLAIAVVHVLLRYTRTGKAMRALADNLDLARVTGIDVDRVILYVWAIAGGLAALSGVLLGLIRPIHPNLGWFLLLPIFAAVILGGIGSAYGAMAGGLVIGVAMEVSPAFGLPVAYKLAVGFAILIAVLLVRPGGIMGKEATR